MTSILPALVIFDLDFMLLPFLISHEIKWPCKKVNDKIIDNDGKGKIINCFPDVPKILEKLKTADIKIAIINYTFDPFAANEIIWLFDWDKYFSFKEIHTQNRTSSLKELQTKSKIPFSEMVYFDNRAYNVDIALKMGVYSVKIDPKLGITIKTLEDALKEFEMRSQNGAQNITQQ